PGALYVGTPFIVVIPTVGIGLMLAAVHTSVTVAPPDATHLRPLPAVCLYGWQRAPGLLPARHAGRFARDRACNASHALAMAGRGWNCDRRPRGDPFLIS